MILTATLIIAGALVQLVIRANADAPPQGPALVVPVAIAYLLGLFVSRHFAFAKLFNHVWNHTRVDEHRFRATLETNKWLGLQLTNLGAIIISAGLLLPWATIRAQRYAASCLHFVPAGPLDAIERVGSAKGSATGDMAAEFIGLDFGL